MLKSLKRSRARLAAVGIAALLAAGMSLPSVSASATDEDQLLGAVPFDGGLPDGVTLSAYKPVAGEMSLATSQALWNLELSGDGASANTYEWVSETETLRIYTTESEEHWKTLSKVYMPTQAIEIVPAAHSKESIDEVLERIVTTGGQLPDGSRIVTAIPEYDGASITIGVERHDSSSKRATPLELETALGTDVPLQIEDAPEVSPVKRNHAPSDPYWFAGATMSTKHVDNRWGECTTAFRIGQLNGGSSAGMLSAEHCGRGKPTSTWHYSTTQFASNQTNATWLGDFQGAMTSIGYQSDTALWTAGNLAKLYPIVFTGNNTDVNNYAAIQGPVYPAVGTDVCYSGSPSGRVCGNEVTIQAAAVCYSTTQCYAGVSFTSQNTGTPAAGNGDSGGPVYQSVGGKIMAAGVISGIVNGNSTCTGDASTATRQCSPQAIYAPIATALGSGSGWGLSYYP